MILPLFGQLFIPSSGHTASGLHAIRLTYSRDPIVLHLADFAHNATKP